MGIEIPDNLRQALITSGTDVIDSLERLKVSDIEQMSQSSKQQIENALSDVEKTNGQGLESDIDRLRNDLRILFDKDIEGVQTTRLYFEKYAKQDYEACAKANGGKVVSHMKNPFQLANGESLRFSGYLGRIGKMFGETTTAERLKKWKELSGLEVVEHMETDEEYFREHAREDYEACAKANGGKVVGSVKNPFQLANGESLGVAGYLIRIGKAYGLASWKEKFKMWKELAEVVEYMKTDKEYFREHAREDYEACAKANGGKVVTYMRNPFQLANGEELTILGYLKRIGKIYDLKTGKQQFNKWKELTGREVVEYMKTDKEYFREHAREDYEACAKANGGKVVTSRKNLFQLANGESITPDTYLRRIGRVFGIASWKEQFKMWKELAEVVEYRETDEEYFREHAREDYEACAKANVGKVSTYIRNPFQLANGESLSVAGYLWRIGKVFGIDGKAEQLKKWRALAGHDVESLEDQKSEELAEYALEDAIAALQHDPLKLKMYIQMAHPELSEEEIDQLVITSFRGFRGPRGISREEKYLSEYELLLPEASLSRIPEQTGENTVTVSGHAPEASHIYISGCWNRRVNVTDDGTFEVTVPLRHGKLNDIKVMGIDITSHTRSEQSLLQITKTAIHDEVKMLIAMIDQMSQKALDDLRQDPQRTEILAQFTEQILIKQFAASFAAGEAYVTQLIAESATPLVRKILKRALNNFRSIQASKIPSLKEGTELYFFQKYCVVKIRQKIKEAVPGIILANEPGLGKTVVALASTADEENVIISPNSVVTTWMEENHKFFEDAQMLILHNISSIARKKLLRHSQRPDRTITNIEFLRQIEDSERFELLSGSGDGVIIYDEAHSRKNTDSKQSQGSKKLQGRFSLLMTATPFKNPTEFRRMMHALFPEKKEYQSDTAFEAVFPFHDPKALRALSILKEQHVIRFRKQDVLSTIDPSQPLSQQHNCLPLKTYISSEEAGKFVMTDEQAESIYEMFLHWDQWCQKYGKYIPDDEVNKVDGLRKNRKRGVNTGSLFAKKHALRQSINNMDYIGAHDDTPKDAEVARIIEYAWREKRKILLFCRYEAQAEKYARLFAHLRPAKYTGMTSKKNLIRNARGKPQLFQTHNDGSWKIGDNGHPVVGTEGRPMAHLDYERIRFQNDPDCRLLIATYSAGSMGVTFTAAKAVVFDDLPEDYVEQYQAEDRAHRIDSDHFTHHDVQYFSLISQYPEQFLQKMKKRWIRKVEGGAYEEERNAARAKKEDLPTAYEMFFEQGTYDEVHGKNLQTQKQMFHLINDGIADETILHDADIAFRGLSKEFAGANEE